MDFGFKDSDGGRKRSRDSSRSRNKSKKKEIVSATKVSKILKISDRLEKDPSQPSTSGLSGRRSSGATQSSSSSGSSSKSRSKLQGGKIPLGPKLDRSERRNSGRIIAAQIAASPVVPSMPAHGAQMMITFDQKTMSWVFPPGFNFSVAKPSDVPQIRSDVPQLRVPSKTPLQPRPPRNYSGKVTDTDSDSSDDDIRGPMVDWSRDPPTSESRKVSKLKISKDNSCGLSVTSDCTTAGSRTSDDAASDDGRSSATPIVHSYSDVEQTQSESQSDTSAPDDASDDESLGEDELKIDTDNDLSDGEPAAVAVEGVEEVEEDDDAGNANDAFGIRRVVDGNGAANVDVAVVDNGPEVNPEGGVNVGGDDGDDELDEEMFQAILEAVIGPDVQRNDVRDFGRDVERQHWNGTVQVLQRVGDERSVFRDRIRELRGLTTPTQAERLELHEKVIFQ